MYDKRRVIASYHEDEHENFKMLYLFIKERELAFLLLGREDKVRTKGSKGTDSDTARRYTSEFSKNSSQLLNAQEMDDDSPYFVKITLNTEFLSLLDESLVDSNELVGPPHQC